MSATSPFRTFRKKVNGQESGAAIQMMLRSRAQRIETLEQFERIVAQATHPERVRRLLEPMLKKGLPCCAMVWRNEHTDGCPTRTMEATG